MSLVVAVLVDLCCPYLHLLHAGLSVASSSVLQDLLVFQGCLFKKYFAGSCLSSVVLREYKKKKRPLNVPSYQPINIFNFFRKQRFATQDKTQRLMYSQGTVLTVSCGAVICIMSDFCVD